MLLTVSLCGVSEPTGQAGEEEFNAASRCCWLVMLLSVAHGEPTETFSADIRTQQQKAASTHFLEQLHGTNAHMHSSGHK